MQIDSHFLVSLFEHPERLCDLKEHQRPFVLLILRQQKVLPKFAYLFFQYQEQASNPKEMDEKTLRHLRNAFRIAEKQKEQVAFEADEIVKALSPVSRFVVFLKGAAYSLNQSEVGQGRIYSDIDILVNKDDLHDCEQHLGMHGWIGGEITDYDEKYYRKWAHEIPPLTHVHRGTNIDVHHNIIPVVSKDAPNATILEKYIVKNDHGIQTLTIDAQFVHCCVHLFRNEDYQTAFRDILDLRFMLIDVNDPELKGVMRVAKDLGFEYEVGLALYFVQEIFGLALPQAVIDKCLNMHRFKSRIDLWIFSSVLLPKHTHLKPKSSGFKLMLAEFRGHLIKMPLPLLTYHLTMKMGRGIIQKVMGEHFFSRKEEQFDPTDLTTPPKG